MGKRCDESIVQAWEAGATIQFRLKDRTEEIFWQDFGYDENPRAQPNFNMADVFDYRVKPDDQKTT